MIEDERDDEMTEFNAVEVIMPPFVDLIPKDEDQTDNIQTGSDDAPYGGVIWNTLHRNAIEKIHAIFSSVEQMGAPDVCIRVML